MNLIFRLLLTMNATSWMLFIYAVKDREWTICSKISNNITCFILLLMPVVLSIISIFISGFLSSDNIKECEEFNLADNEYLPTYLGYFFLSLSIPDRRTLLVLYLIVSLFTFLSQTQYFNPIFLLFGYHYYHILTKRGTRVFVISRSKVIRNKDNISFEHLRRINDTTYIERG